MIWDAADRPAPFAGRVQVEEEQAEPTPQATTVADGPRAEGIEAASASTAPIASAATDIGVAALLDLLGDTAPSTAPEIAEAEPAPSTVPPPQMSLAPSQDRAEPPGRTSWPAASEHPDAQAHHQRRQGPGAYRRRYDLSRQPRRVPALRAGVPSSRRAGQAGEAGGVAVGTAPEKLGQHRKQPSGLNIWTCEVTGPRKSRRLHGYLLASPEALFRDAARQPIPAAPQRAAKREDSAPGARRVVSENGK